MFDIALSIICGLFLVATAFQNEPNKAERVTPASLRIGTAFSLIISMVLVIYFPPFTYPNFSTHFPKNEVQTPYFLAKIGENKLANLSLFLTLTIFCIYGMMYLHKTNNVLPKPARPANAG